MTLSDCYMDLMQKVSILPSIVHGKQNFQSQEKMNYVFLVEKMNYAFVLRYYLTISDLILFFYYVLLFFFLELGIELGPSRL